METLNYQGDFQRSIVEIFDNKVKNVLSTLMPFGTKDSERQEILESVRSFLTTLSYCYNRENTFGYDERAHKMLLPNSLEQDPMSTQFDVEHAVVQLALSSLCRSKDGEISHYMDLFIDNLATICVGNTEPGQENRYALLNQLGEAGVNLLINIYFTGNPELIREFKNGIATTPEIQESFQR